MTEKSCFLKSQADSKNAQKIIAPLKKLIAILAIVGLWACYSISLFDHYAYTQSTGLKVDSLKLMNKATEDFSRHEAEVDDLLTRIEKAYEYEKARPKNVITTKMWEKLKDSEKNLLGGFLKFWQEKKTLSKTFVEEAKKTVSDAFDQIIGLESGKIKKSEVTI
jgi:hypothetical protein